LFKSFHFWLSFEESNLLSYWSANVNIFFYFNNGMRVL
jgi:hypothetical protein